MEIQESVLNSASEASLDEGTPKIEHRQWYQPSLDCIAQVIVDNYTTKTRIWPNDNTLTQLGQMKSQS